MDGNHSLFRGPWLWVAAAALIWAGFSPGAHVFATGPDPLTGEPAWEESEGRWLWELKAADNALRLGFAAVAAGMYDRLLADWPEGREGRNEVELSLAAALLAERRVALAAELLAAHADDPSPRWRLRRALLDFHRRDWPGLQSKVEELEEAGLPESEAAWFHFLQAVSWERGGRAEEAAAAHERAMEAAVSENQKAAFGVSRHRTLLVTAEPSAELAEQLQARMEEFQGRSAGFRFAQQYAVVLDALGKKQEAVEVILRTIQTIPTADREMRDQFLLLNGLIAGSESGPGRESLRELLETGGSRELQRIALHKLAQCVRVCLHIPFGHFRKLLSLIFGHKL